jgi:hypothetical protein
MRRLPAFALCGVVAFLIMAALPAGAGRRFFDDDPIASEPETQDASKAQEWEIDLFIDLATNLFGRPGDPAPNVPARNVNTIDEVPDSSWFTNRMLVRPVSTAELVRGPLTGSGPAPGPWTVIAQKSAGFAPGFTVRDTKGEMWFVSFDAAGHPEAATGAIVVANRIFWALGYWQVENYLVNVDPDEVVIGTSSVFTPMSGRKRPMKRSDLDDVFRRAHRTASGYRAVAARAVPGKPIGGFRYDGTRPDDPNDVVPHEHRRELRALKVFGAWTNLVDMKAGNTLDTVIRAENGQGRVRHYLQDVGSTFGTGANGPREYDEGWEYLFDAALVRRRLATLGFFIQPWQTIDYVENPAIGRFEGRAFEPAEWKPRVPTAAFLRARSDDTFWAARRVAAFSDEMVRAVVTVGSYSDPAAEALLADVLIQRRDKIAAHYLGAINPLVDFALSPDGRLTFRNAAVDRGGAMLPAGGYRTTWARFDNATGDSTNIGAATATASNEVQAPVPLARAVGTFIRVDVSAVEPAPAPWTIPVTVYFRSTDAGWTLTGVDRLPKNN